VDVPRGPEDVAWFDLGPRPGENGDAVIDGHSGWKDNMPAVFNNLSKLQKGDKIYIEDGKGTTIAFVVREIKSYNPEANVPDVFNSNDEKAHLNLITCSGYWNDAEKTHSDRLVVFADKIF
jgi:LPXTG-site transpeptidase (sortase) family protein